MATAAPTNRGRKTLTRVVHEVPSILRRPERSWFDRYIGRSFEGDPADPDTGVSDFDIANVAFETAKNILIEGPTGPGKTTFMMAYAAMVDRWFYSIPSAGNAEPSQLFGKFVPNGEGGWRWQDGPVTFIIRNGGILLINEINFMPPAVMSVLFGLLDSRREIVLLDKDGEVVRAHRPTQKDVLGNVVSRCWCDDPDAPDTCRSKWVLVAADMNPGYAGTRPLNLALNNRFPIKLFWDYDTKVEAQLTVSPKLREMASHLRRDHVNGKYTTPVSTNMLIEFEQNLNTLGPKMAAYMFVNAYPVADRSAVRIVVDTHLADIEGEVTLAIAKGTTAPDFSKMTEAQKEAWRLQLKPGEVDPEWGIYGTAWSWGTADEEANDE